MREQVLSNLKNYIRHYIEKNFGNNTYQNSDAIYKSIQQLELPFTQLFSNRPTIYNLQKDETAVLRNYIGFYNNGTKQTYETVGEKLNLTKERIRQKLAIIASKLLRQEVQQMILNERNRKISKTIINEDIRSLILSKNISFLHLPVKLLHTLYNNNINSIGDIVYIEVINIEKLLTPDELREVYSKIKRLGLEFKNEIEIFEIIEKNYENKNSKASSQEIILTIELQETLIKSLQNLYDILDPTNPSNPFRDIVKEDEYVYQKAKENQLFFLEIFDWDKDTAYNLTEQETSILRYYIGMTNNGKIQDIKEIGQIEDCRETTITKCLYSALAKLHSQEQKKKIFEERNKIIRKHLKIKVDILSTDISFIHMPSKLYQALHKIGIHTINDLLNISYEDIKKLNETQNYSNIIVFPKFVVETIHQLGLEFEDEDIFKKIYNTNETIEKLLDTVYYRICCMLDKTTKMEILYADTFYDLLTLIKFSPEFVERLGQHNKKLLNNMLGEYEKILQEVNNPTNQEELEKEEKRKQEEKLNDLVLSVITYCHKMKINIDENTQTIIQQTFKISPEEFEMVLEIAIKIKTEINRLVAEKINNQNHINNKKIY